MGKAALGKGMKDLLAKNLEVGSKKAPKDEKMGAKEELDVNIGRYQAQGYDVAMLKSLRKKEAPAILKGIEDFRDKVKILNSIQTVIRSLEGYGYSKEIESITERLKDPSRARELVQEVEDLKYRAKTEHAIDEEKRSAPRKKLSKSLKEKAKMLKEEDQEEGSAPQEMEGIDDGLLDGMLDDLTDIEDAFSLEMKDDPFLKKISKWEEMGYFVDGLKTTLTESGERAEEEAVQFEKDVRKMEKIKERFKEMDLTGFKTESQEIQLKFQYPHLSGDVENQLDEIDRIKREAEKELGGTAEETTPPEEPEEEIPEEPGEETPEPAPEQEEETPAPEPETEVKEEVPEEEVEEDIPPPPQDPTIDVQEAPIEPVEDTPTEPEPEPAPEHPPEPTPEPQPEEEVPPQAQDDIYSGKSADELMEMAKDSYKDGSMEESLLLFKEVLKKDPESSKARFMIRRISSKLS